MNKRNVIITIISVLISTCLFAFARTTTTNLSLVKPTWTEALDILTDINANSDAIDAAFSDPLAYSTDTITKSEFADEDWGDMAVSSNLVILDADVVDATALKDDNTPADGDIFTYELTGTTGHWMTLAELSIQPLDATLTAVAGLTITANSLIYGTGTDAFAILATNATATNKFLREVSSGAPAWATLVAGDIPDISATYQPLDIALTNISALAYVSPSFIKLTADDTYAVRTLAQTLTDIDGAASGANTDITSLAGLTTALSIAQGGTGLTTGALTLLSTTTVAFNANGDTPLYVVPAGKRCVLTHAIVVAAGDAGATTTVSIGQNTAETDFVPANTLSNLDAQYDSVILQPIPNTTPLKLKSYAAATVIQAQVASQSGVVGNTIYLFGILY